MLVIVCEKPRAMTFAGRYDLLPCTAQRHLVARTLKHSQSKQQQR